MLRQVKPRNARSARAVAAKAPHETENPKTALFLRNTNCSEIAKLCMRDLEALRRPLTLHFTKKNAIHPFEDASSLEFFSEKNDCSLIVFGCHTKKRPHCLTFVRTFDYKLLDMLELYVDPDTLRTLVQFKGRKVAVGLKPMVCFAGIAFESPVPNAYTLAKSILLDYFKGPDVKVVDVEGLQYIICISVGEEIAGQPAPKIHVRSYLIKTKRSGQKLPRVEVEEMGPRMDFRVGRIQQADDNVMKEALKRPKGTEAKPKKNIETDLIGDKVGRIHMGKQDLGNLQTRKMKGLKRSRDLEADMEEMSMLVSNEDEGMNGINHEAKKLRV